jgi:hypothetical protein
VFTALSARLSIRVPLLNIHTVSESVLYVYERFVKGSMMAVTGTDRILAAEVISPIRRHDRGAVSFHEAVGHLGRERALSVGPGIRKKGGDEQKSAQPTTIVVIEQWICLVLGLVCMAFGICGICMKPGQGALSAYIAWLGSIYVPVLRVTAVACLGMGVVLIRRGWTHL